MSTTTYRSLLSLTRVKISEQMRPLPFLPTNRHANPSSFSGSTGCTFGSSESSPPDAVSEVSEDSSAGSVPSRAASAAGSTRHATRPNTISASRKVRTKFRKALDMTEFLLYINRYINRCAAYAPPNFPQCSLLYIKPRSKSMKHSMKKFGPFRARGSQGGIAVDNSA